MLDEHKVKIFILSSQAMTNKIRLRSFKVLEELVNNYCRCICDLVMNFNSPLSIGIMHALAATTTLQITRI